MSLLLPAVLFLHNAMLQLHGGSSYHQIILLKYYNKKKDTPNRKAVLLWSRYVFVGLEKKFIGARWMPAFVHACSLRSTLTGQLQYGTNRVDQVNLCLVRLQS